MAPGLGRSVRRLALVSVQPDLFLAVVSGCPKEKHLPKPCDCGQSVSPILITLNQPLAEATEPSFLGRLWNLGTLGVLSLTRSRRIATKGRQARVNFLADSLAGLDRVSPRRSRDIVAQEYARYRAKTKHRILRHEFYAECSCGYKGPARDNACRKCGAEIPPSLEELLMPRLF